MNMWWWQPFLTIFIGSCLVSSQFLECHDDAVYHPEEGILDEMQFTWLGVLQYIHVKNGTPHYFRVPRVILISRQFVLGTAVDVAEVPENYALGNVVFGEYERDEVECGLNSQEYVEEGKCDPAIMVIPLSDVLLHPEYKHFGAANSVALLKLITPIKSDYMLPVCLPFKNYIRRKMSHSLWHVDFATDAPRAFNDEEKYVSQIHALPKELCFFNQVSGNITNMTNGRTMCTSDCGFHSGAPTIVHEHTGHFTVVSITERSAPCPDPYRRRAHDAPRHILLHPYVPWITSAITGKRIGAYTEVDPFGFTMPRQSADTVNDRKKQRGWVGHWWLAGIRCFDRGVAADDIFRFYHETFFINHDNKANLNYFLQIDSAPDSVIVCIKVGTPFKVEQPKVWELNTEKVHLRIVMKPFTQHLKFFVEGWAVLQAKPNSASQVNTSKTISTSEEDP